MVEYGQKELALDLRQGSIETYKFDESYDLVSMIQVIGHFYDLNAALRKVSFLVKEGGGILIESWNMNSLYAKLLGKNWHEYSPPSVLNWFSKSTLKEYLKEYGFSHVRTGSPYKKISLNHALTLFSYKYPKINPGMKVIECIIGKRKVNLPYPPIDVFWSLFKKDLTTSTGNTDK